MKQMTSFIYPFFLVIIVLAGCARSEPEHASEQLRPNVGLTVAEARDFFENNVRRLTRSDGNEEVQGVFAAGEIVPDWSKAEMSANERLKCVDVAAETNSEFRILRRREDGSMYEVRAYGKLLIVKSAETDSLAAFMRYVVPDEIYTDYYDGDLSDLFANCDERLDYCGLEIYTALDGAIVAAASYYEGRLLDRVFLGDERLSRAQRDYRLRYLLRGVFIHRATTGMTRNSDFDFGGRSCFVDSTGTTYFVKYIDGVGYATMDFDNEFGGCQDGKIVDPGENGGGSGGGSDGGNTGGDNPGRGTGPGIGGPDPGGPGFGGGGSGGSNGNDNGNETGPKPDLPYNPAPDSVVLIEKPEPQFPRYPFIWIDPIPFDPITPGIIPEPDPDEPEEPEEPEEEKPCFDLDSVRANPLMDMKILGTKNNGVKGGRYGNGRGRKHNGIDLVAPIGTPVYAMFDGEVTKVITKYDPKLPYKDYEKIYFGEDVRDYNAGNRIWIESMTPKGKILVKYFHLNDACVKKGLTLHRGDIIGHTGATGSACCSESAGPHLHIEVYENDKRVDPEEYLYTQFDQDGNIITMDCHGKMKKYETF